MPCGMIRFTCEKYPTVTYMNAQMKRLLGVTNENLRLLEYLRDNIFFMFPQEERERFREQLDAVEQQGDVVTCRHRITCCDGTIVAVSGWLSKVEDQAGNSEYQAVYSGSVAGEEKPKICIQNMIQMLDGTYDAVFAVDFLKNIVCCLKVNEYHISDEIQGIRMILEDAVKCWVGRLVMEADQEKVVCFLKNFNERREEDLEFRAMDRNGEIRNYCGEFLFIDQKTMLFCCREIKKEQLAGEEEEKVEERKILIRTFGNFDVFVDGKAIHFPSKKAKEFLAILVDRRGGFVTSNEAISLLWEDACAGERANGRFRKAVMDLRRTLDEYEIGELLIRINQESRIDIGCIECDLYQYLEERDKYRKLFQGEYMSNYSWGESTLGGLMNEEE